MMKVAIIGSHGCGKTALAFSLCTELQKRGHRVELVVEMARRSPFPINEATSEEGQLWILHRHIVAELEASARAATVVCDRSVLDNYAYYSHKFGRRPHLDALVREWTKTYALLVKVPIVDHWLINDGVRSVDRQFQAQIDALVETMLKELAHGNTGLLRLSYPFDVEQIIAALPTSDATQALSQQAAYPA
ncbi:MAG: ATP-binding protein [Acidobacteriota bacterium]|nr:ATP-binding protein [Blastocatellia bacterium]MDW8238821.1 ATP-binding protein [Acidobacteriota bacterium]